MKSKPEEAKPERERKDWLIVLLILLLGFLCVIVAGQRALLFSPTWTLDADMESKLNPNSDFLTKPGGFVEPVDPAILTQPAWVKVFLTPGASFVTGTAPPAGSGGGVPTQAVGTTVVPTNTIPVFTNTAVPTNTFIWLPVTNTPKPGGGGPTDTPIPPPTNVDLSINKVNSAAWYAPGSPFSYTITITNPPAGSNAVTGATVTDILPAAQISLPGTTWTCAGAGGATCNTPAGSGNINNAVVNLPLNSSVTFTINVAFNLGVSGPLMNQATVNVPAGYNDTNPGNNTSPVTTSNPGVDLQITKLSTGPDPYGPGGAVSYTIDVTNNSSFTLNGVTVTDVFSAQIDPASINWSCAPLVGAPTCIPAAGAGDINDSLNMPPGSAAQYTVNGTMEGAAVGPLPNTANVIAPAGFTETNPGDETSPVSTNGPPSVGNINIGPRDGSVDTLGPPFPTSLTMVIPPIVANGDGAYDFVYYERLVPAAPVPPPPAHVELDWVQIEISSDGITWYTVFNFNGGAEDPNTNINGQCPGEPDNCFILPGNMYNNTGVAINIDTIVPAGNYSWIRITSPASPGGDGSDVDAIEIL